MATYVYNLHKLQTDSILWELNVCLYVTITEFNAVLLCSALHKYLLALN